VLDVEVAPVLDRETADAAYQRWRRAVDRSRDWAREPSG
jgi:hypothetical protein